MLSEIIKNRLQEKNSTLESLQKQTNIPLRYLISFEAGNFSDLPAPVFVHGYLKKISKALELDEEILWEEFKKDSKDPRFLEIDALPKNRFEHSLKLRQHFSKLLKILPITIIAIILLGFLFFQIKSLLGNPNIRLENPATDLSTTDTVIEVRGYGPSNSYITINGKEVYLEKDGYFNETIELNPGLNEIIIQAQNKLKKTTTITKHIFKEE